MVLFCLVLVFLLSVLEVRLIRWESLFMGGFFCGVGYWFYNVVGMVGVFGSL